MAQGQFLTLSVDFLTCEFLPRFSEQTLGMARAARILQPSVERACAIFSFLIP